MSKDKDRDEHPQFQPNEEDKPVHEFDWNVIELNNRGFFFTDHGRLVTIDDLKRMHELQEGDRESLEKNFD